MNHEVFLSEGILSSESWASSNKLRCFNCALQRVVQNSQPLRLRFELKKHLSAKTNEKIRHFVLGLKVTNCIHWIPLWESKIATVHTVHWTMHCTSRCCFRIVFVLLEKGMLVATRRFWRTCVRKKSKKRVLTSNFWWFLEAPVGIIPLCSSQKKHLQLCNWNSWRCKYVKFEGNKSHHHLGFFMLHSGKNDWQGWRSHYEDVFDVRILEREAAA